MVKQAAAWRYKPRRRTNVQQNQTVRVSEPTSEPMSILMSGEDAKRSKTARMFNLRRLRRKEQRETLEGGAVRWREDARRKQPASVPAPCQFVAVWRTLWHRIVMAQGRSGIRSNPPRASMSLLFDEYPATGYCRYARIRAEDDRTERQMHTPSRAVTLDAFAASKHIIPPVSVASRPHAAFFQERLRPFRPPQHKT